jgi:hypothetical protein
VPPFLSPRQTPPEKPGGEEDQTSLGLGQETEALINTIAQQLGGSGGVG